MPQTLSTYKKHQVSIPPIALFTVLPIYFPSGMHRLIPHQFKHQIRERPIRIHQLRRRTDKVIRKLLHASKKPILENIVGTVHPVDHLHCEAHNRCLVLPGRCNFRHNDRLVRVQIVHVLDFLNRSVAIRPVVVHAEVVGRIAGDLAHEIRNPSVASVIACA